MSHWDKSFKALNINGEMTLNKNYDSKFPHLILSSLQIKESGIANPLLLGVDEMLCKGDWSLLRTSESGMVLGEWSKVHVREDQWAAGATGCKLFW